MFGGKNGGGGEAKRARAEEAARQAEIRRGMGEIDKTFGQFDDGFYGGRREAYMDFATPQLEDQFQKATEALTFALARSGNLDSSSRSDQMGELAKLYDTNRQQITDQALDYETQARDSVEGARSDLTRTLNATGDAEAAANSALSRASILSRTPAFSPIGDLFAKFTQGLGTQAAYERAGAIDPRFGGRYDTGLFGSPASSAVKVTR